MIEVERVNLTTDEAYQIMANGLSKAPSKHEWCMAYTMAINSLKAWSNLESEILAIGNWQNENEISDYGVKDCLAIIDRHIAEIRGD